VRKLAERSQVAAKEIGEKATVSVGVAERSGALLNELVPSIEKTSTLVQEVSAASKEQAVGVQQINKAIAQLDTVTQRNAAAAEELASTAEELAAQAEALQQQVSFFKLPTEIGSSWTERRPTAPLGVAAPRALPPACPKPGKSNGSQPEDFAAF